MKKNTSQRETASIHFLRGLNIYLNNMEDLLECTHKTNREVMKSLQKYRTWISVKTREAKK